MPNIRISQLPIETSINETDVFPSVINGATSQISLKNTAQSIGITSDWVNPNNNTWRIRNYSGGNSVSYTDGGSPAVWFDISDSIWGSSQFRGAVVDFHAYFSGDFRGTMIGTVWISEDDDQNPEHIRSHNGQSIVADVSMWDQPGYGQIGTSLIDYNYNVMVQWTSRVFYGSEVYC
jgi:hypothetical protein